MARLEQEQQESVALIQSLAEQDAQLVQAVEALRQSHQRLWAAIAVVAVVCEGSLVWALRR